MHPIVEAWFAERVGQPTEVQRLAWPRIAAGEHVLAIAPTGSGKTLAAFLGALDRLLTGEWEGGRVRVLYVSPLRALGNDVRRNLLGPLAELRSRFASAGHPAPEIRVATRTGDTPAAERARMLRRPPEILVSTPETLNVLLTSRRGRDLLSRVASVILDEVHAVAGTKRGALLVLDVERLSRLVGEFQRIALSATVRPLERVAEWIGGSRPVAVVRSSEPKRYEISVGFPGSSGGDHPPARDAGPWTYPRTSTETDPFWRAVVAELREPLERNRSTLVFANSKRMVEKLTRLLNGDGGDQVVYSHHGALSREVRQVVEERLKRGELKGIVATNSLELGIDIGSLDEVVLAQTPPSLASAAQRIGRAGHAVGGTSRGRFLALHPRDLLCAAAASRAVLEGEIEPVRPVAAPLDVLAQAILSMVATESRGIEEMWSLVRGSDPFRELPRRSFDLVLEMLAGRYASSRIRPLRPRLRIDREEGTVRGLPGVERLVYLSGGTIPDRGHFHLRRDGSGALLGELDEEFVWERKVADTFTLGVHGWRIERITHNDVFVSPVAAGTAMAPFWRADERDRGVELSRRVAALLEEADAGPDDPSFVARLESAYRLEPGAARVLSEFLAGEHRVLGGVLPHGRRVVIERVASAAAGGASEQAFLHTFWGGRVHRPLALALAAAWEARHGTPLEIAHDDDCLAVFSTAGIDPGALLSLVVEAPIERLLRERLERTGFFGARFREAAGIALLLPREGFRRRTPLWLSRQRAKELFEAVSRYEDFPIRIEAWRACLADAFDLDALHRLLDDVRAGRIEVRVATTAAPSPFAAGVAWKRTNELMYADDAPPVGAGAGPRMSLIREAVFAAHLRPRVPAAIAEALRRKLQRTFPGYAPRTPDELLSWVEERVAIPRDEWGELLAAIERDHGIAAAEITEGIGRKIEAVRLAGPDGPELIVAAGSLPRLRRAIAGRSVGAGDDDPVAEILGEVLRYYGPVDPSVPALALGLSPEQARETIESLAEAQRVVLDRLTEDVAEIQVCDADNLEVLLRAVRAGARPRFETLSPRLLPGFLAEWQGLARDGEGAGAIEAALDPLLGWAAPAGAWETEILPARLASYRPEWLDALLASSDLGWTGCGERRIAFVLPGDRERIAEPRSEEDREADGILPRDAGRLTFEELARRSGLPTAELTRRLWRLVWRGEVSNDRFAAVRQGLLTGFEPAEAGPPSPGAPRSGRLRFDRWRTTRPFAGSWYRAVPIEDPADALELDEAGKDRARLVLARYGVVFRELLERELPPLRWGRVFRALRLMELSGEVVAGPLFLGVAGLQFALPAAVERLRTGLDAERVWWVGAADPASPCGLDLDGLDPRLPRRVAGSHVVFHGARAVVVSTGRGRRLDILAGPDDPRLPGYFGFLDAALHRPVSPARSISIETINDAPAADSPYAPALSERFDVARDARSLSVRRRYGTPRVP